MDKVIRILLRHAGPADQVVTEVWHQLGPWSASSLSPSPAGALELPPRHAHQPPPVERHVDEHRDPQRQPNPLVDEHPRRPGRVETPWKDHPQEQGRDRHDESQDPHRDIQKIVARCLFHPVPHLTGISKTTARILGKR